MRLPRRLPHAAPHARQLISAATAASRRSCLRRSSCRTSKTTGYVFPSRWAQATGSMRQHLYLSRWLRWPGLLIEAHPALHADVVRNRPGVVAINTAICPAHTTVACSAAPSARGMFNLTTLQPLSRAVHRQPHPKSMAACYRRAQGLPPPQRSTCRAARCSTILICCAPEHRLLLARRRGCRAARRPLNRVGACTRGRHRRGGLITHTQHASQEPSRRGCAARRGADAARLPPLHPRHALRHVPG